MVPAPQLDSLRALVKGELTFFQREVLCALIVVEVHARDVTHTLVDENVRNVADFQWICQLRCARGHGGLAT